MSEEKREISFQELVRTLIEHRKWIVSKGDEGQRADLGNVRMDPRKINLRMVFLPGANFTAADFQGANLRGANLHGAYFGGANFHGAYLGGANLHGANLGGANLHGAYLSLADLRGADLHGTYLSMADLHDANLHGVNLHEANLHGANLQGAYLGEAILHRANLQGANLQGVNLCWASLYLANLQGANLYEANLQGADFHWASLYLANLHRANLHRANLQGASLFQANLYGADLSAANLEAADVTNIKYDKKVRFHGIRIDGCYGNAQFKRHAQDQDWLKGFLDTRETRRQKAWAWFWKESCDYGRSFGRWALLSSLLAIFFGSLFYILGPKAFDIAHLPKYPSPWGLGSMLYYSVVTFTTLGFGDVVPKTIPAAILVMIEVIIGYIMLGGLISILANKLARRS
jgi:uncharacterized protein YjbI with pentapeptide repeats